MRRFTEFFAISAVLLALLVPPVIALLRAAPIADPGAPPVRALDPYPNLPPLSELARLPSADIAADWARLQIAVRDEAIAKIRDRTLPLQLRRRYEDILFETGKRIDWVSNIQGAHDPNLDECTRRNCIEHLQGYEAYWTGRWPPPVPVELMPEEKAWEPVGK